MTEGPILKKLFKFALPLAVINVIQLLYNAIDITILGNFAGDDAVAAVGSTGSLNAVLCGLFYGLSGGVNVVVARAVGAKDMARARRATGTALLTGIVCGLFLMAVAIPFGPTLLRWMNCDPDVLPAATLYLRIIFASMPLQMLYNFVSSAIRASGNSTRPMIIGLTAGGCKVGFNFLFVGLLKLGAPGAAISTFCSQIIAFTLVFTIILKDRNAYYALEKKYLRINKEDLADIVRIGLPGGLSGTFFYGANAVIQSCVNSMGKVVMTADAVAAQFDSFIYTVGAAVASATMAFVAQNMGAGKLDRVKKALGTACGLATTVSLALGVVFLMFSSPLCGLVTDNPEVIAIAKTRMTLLCLTYFTSSIMEVFNSSLSSMGWHRSTMYVGFFCGLGARVLWAKCIWPSLGTLAALYISFPVSNLLAIGIYLRIFKHAILVLENRFAYRKLEAQK